MVLTLVSHFCTSPNSHQDLTGWFFKKSVKNFMAWNSTNIFTLLAMSDPRVVYLLLCYALRTCTSSEFFCTITTRTEEKLQTLTKNFLLYQDHTWLYALKIQERLCLLSKVWTYLYMDRTAGLQNCCIWPAHMRPKFGPRWYNLSSTSGEMYQLGSILSGIYLH